jgi:hypothetical protein
MTRIHARLPPERNRRVMVREWFGSVRPIERSCYVIGAALMLAGLAHLMVAAIDTRPWSGPLSWRKPVTFGLSFGITLIAITWVSSYLRTTQRVRSSLLGIFAVDCIVEVLGITIQAWRHVPSHFNTESTFDSVIAYGLAAGGAVLIVVLGSFAILAFRGRIEGPPSMRLALQLGFALLLAGLASGVAMIVRGTSLVRSGDPSGYSAAGYLKWFHGITLHAVLVLPLLAWWLSRRHATETTRVRVVAGAGAAYVFVALVALIQAVGIV